MKKGDIRKAEILQTAELLFCKKGFEQTSIQDILDMLNLSKGSFYHHFVSKESLLETICQKRAEEAYTAVQNEFGKAGDPISKLNQLLSAVIPIEKERLAFILMLLPVFSRPEGQSIKTAYSNALALQFHDAVETVIQEGCRNDTMYCTDSDIASEICLSLVNQLWIRIYDKILEYKKNNQFTEPSELLHITDQYRIAIEKVLSAPFGSVELINFPILRSIIDQIHAHRVQ